MENRRAKRFLQEMAHIRCFEYPVNWRIARLGFRCPATQMRFDEMTEIQPSDWTLFLPQDRTLDVIELRDWLHDSDNNGGGYQMTGCYERNSDRMIFTGLKFAFSKAIDAVFFRLCWCSAVVVQSRYSDV
jgi:hypothetical protein